MKHPVCNPIKTNVELILCGSRKLKCGHRRVVSTPLARLLVCEKPDPEHICVWQTGSTNHETMKGEPPQRCQDKRCKGHDKNCESHAPKHKVRKGEL